MTRGSIIHSGHADARGTGGSLISPLSVSLLELTTNATPVTKAVRPQVTYGWRFPSPLQPVPTPRSVPVLLRNPVVVGWVRDDGRVGSHKGIPPHPWERTTLVSRTSSGGVEGTTGVTTGGALKKRPLGYPRCPKLRNDVPPLTVNGWGGASPHH